MTLPYDRRLSRSSSVDGEEEMAGISRGQGAGPARGVEGDRSRTKTQGRVGASWDVAGDSRPARALQAAAPAGSSSCSSAPGPPAARTAARSRKVRRCSGPDDGRQNSENGSAVQLINNGDGWRRPRPSTTTASSFILK